jgi:dienelactone hydrolase
MTLRDIEFDAEGVTLRGWFYPAEGAGGPAPSVVMAHGFSAVKEMYLDSFAHRAPAQGTGHPAGLSFRRLRQGVRRRQRAGA